MWALWVFGNPVNRRLGNFFYLMAYLGTIIFLGLVARICYFGPVVGASGGIFAIVIIAAMLMPSALLTIAYAAIFPFSVLIGLIRRPKHGIYWFVCGGQFRVRAFWCLVFIPILEFFSMFWALWTEYGSVWNLGHLLGMVCGVAVVLLLPTRITMKKRSSGYI
jgi:membrane associated rhomboid family serine protease